MTKLAKLIFSKKNLNIFINYISYYCHKCCRYSLNIHIPSLLSVVYIKQNNMKNTVNYDLYSVEILKYS